MLWQSGPDSLARYVNKRWLDFTGRSYADEVDNGWLTAVHPNDVERCLATYLAAFEERRDAEMLYRLRRFDGEYRLVLDRGAPILVEGKLCGYVRGCIDINDGARRATEQQIEIHDRALQTLFSIGLISQAALAQLAENAGSGCASEGVAAALTEIGELASTCTSSIRALIEALAFKSTD
jgi:PAS domain S-box-containing protein